MYLRNKGEIVIEKFTMVEAVYKMINTGLTVATLPLEEINM